MTRYLAPNIVRTFYAADSEQREHGRTWYAEAHALSADIAVEAGLSVNDAAGIIAALSPRESWPRNRTLARLAVRWTDTGVAGWPGLHTNARKALRIAHGESPDAVLGGPKVRAFHAIIVDPSSDAVCIDRHAFDIAVGRVTSDKERAVLSRKGEYDRCARAYVRAARTISADTGQQWTAAQVQAVTWTVWRETKARANHGR